MEQADCSLTKIPLLRFGVIADVQYADNDDKQAWYDKKKTRFYRNSLKQVDKAFQYWEKLGVDSCCEISFILQLGDIIDALNKSSCSHSAIRRTLSCFLNNPKMPTFHTVGNHELYNFNRSQLSLLFDQFLFKELNHSTLNVNNPNSLSGEPNALYYKFNPLNGVKFISLDTYDISVLGYDQSHSKYKLASSILRKYHQNDDFQLWDTDYQLSGPEKRFQSSNGALSDQQLEWLDQELHNSDQNNELVIIFGHGGLHPNSCGWDSILWNYDQVIDCFNRHSSVVAYFNGHAHNSGYAFENNIHYIVLHGIIETPPDTEAFTTVTILDDRIIVDGKGVEKKITLNYHKKFSFNIEDQNLVDEVAQTQDIQTVCEEHSVITDFHCNAIKIQV